MELDLYKIKDIYGNSSIYEIKDHMEEVINNMKYIKSLGFEDIYNIVEVNPYIFLIDSKIFKEKVNNLINKLGAFYFEKLEENIFLWGEIND